MKAKKRTYITDILIVLLVIVLSLFILDGKNFILFQMIIYWIIMRIYYIRVCQLQKKWTCYPMKTLIIHRFIFTK